MPFLQKQEFVHYWSIASDSPKIDYVLKISVGSQRVKWRAEAERGGILVRYISGLLINFVVNQLIKRATTNLTYGGKAYFARKYITSRLSQLWKIKKPPSTASSFNKAMPKKNRSCSYFSVSALQLLLLLPLPSPTMTTSRYAALVTSTTNLC